MKKIILILLLSISFFTQTYAVNDSDQEYNLFFKNNTTNKEKYISPENLSLDYYILKYISKSNIEIGKQTRLQNWSLTKVEKTYHNNENQTTNYYKYLSGNINSNRDYFYFDNKDGIEINSLSDTNKIEKLSFKDLTYKEIFIIICYFFRDFFGILFLIFLPANMLVFGCFGYGLLLIGEKFKLKFLKNIYINSFLSYLIIYVILIINGITYQHATTNPFNGLYLFVGSIGYLVIVIPIKTIFYYISVSTFRKYHKRFDDKKIIYNKVVNAYALLFMILLVSLWVIRFIQNNI